MPINNVCNCPHPPGGQVVCEPNQMAVCIIVNGQARQQCLNPPDEINNALALVTWALSEITIERKRSYSSITNQEIRILASGEYNFNNISVTFSLPQKIKTALEEIINNRGMSSGHEREVETS
jgi:hypothetical protein